MTVKDSSGVYIKSMLPLTGIQRNPNISGHVIAFESGPSLGSPYDIWLYDLATDRRYYL